jgi:hypothetical protein
MRVREVVLQGPFSDLVEPGNIEKVEDVCGMLVKNVTWESRNHTEDGEFSEMKECRPGETTSKEVDNTSGSVLVLPEETP